MAEFRSLSAKRRSSRTHNLTPNPDGFSTSQPPAPGAPPGIPRFLSANLTLETGTAADVHESEAADGAARVARSQERPEGGTGPGMPKFLEMRAATAGSLDNSASVRDWRSAAERSAIPELGSGERLDSSVTERMQSALGWNFGAVRIHADTSAAQAASDLQAQAFTAGRDIVFGHGQYQPGTPSGDRLIGHELVHTLQQRGSEPVIQRQPEPQASAPVSSAGAREPQTCMPPPAPVTTVGPLAPDAGPDAVQTEIVVQAPVLAGATPGGSRPVAGSPGGGAAAEAQAPAAGERIVFHSPILSRESVTLYAVPISAVIFPTDTTGRNTCEEPDQDRSTHAASGSSSPPSVTVPPVSLPPAPPVPSPAPTPAATPTSAPAAAPAAGGPYRTAGAVEGTVYIEGVPYPAVRVTDAYVITTEYTHFAVGAGATTAAITAEGVTLIDAGLGTEAGTEITQAMIPRIRRMVGDRPIREVLISHLHRDHTSLLVELARNFEIQAIRVNALQLLDPRFRELRARMAQAAAERVVNRTYDSVNAARAAWEESGPGAAIADLVMRERAFEAYRTEQIIQARENMRTNQTQLQILVPRGNELHVVNAPLADTDLPSGTVTDTAPVTGSHREAVPGGSRVSLTDPGMSRRLAEQQAAPGERVPHELVDTNSTSYIIDLPGGNRLMVVPDIRTSDITRRARPAPNRDPLNAFEAALSSLGHPARFRIWNMTHHMQAGWVAGGTPHVVGVTQLENFTALMHQLTTRPDAAHGAVSDIVVVSAQAEIGGVAGRNMVNPGMVWFLRALGMEVMIARSGRDIRALEIVTSTGQRLSGLVGATYPGLGPDQPILREAEAAIRHLEQKRAIEQARRAAPGTPRPEVTAFNATRRANVQRITEEITGLRTAAERYLRAVSRTLWRGPDETARPAVAPAEGGPVPIAIRFADRALRESLSRAAADLSDFTPPAVTELPVFTDTALVILRQHEGTELNSRARLSLRLAEEAEALRTELRNAPGHATLRVRLTGALMNLRDNYEAQLEGAPEPTRTLVEHELGLLRQEIESLTRPPGERGGGTSLSRDPAGRIVETRVIPVSGERSGASRGTQIIRTVGERAGQALGGVMVYQLIRSEGHLQAEADDNRTTPMQFLTGTTHNALGATIGVRMMVGRHVGMGEFVIMSALDIIETASANYASDEERERAVYLATVRNAVSLALATLGQAMMQSQNPYLAGAGLAVTFLVDPILNAVGFYDYVENVIERATSFQPTEVTEAGQSLRRLLVDYRRVIGGLELIARSDDQLRAVGVADPAAFRASNREAVDARRAELTTKETELESAFQEGYTRARTGYSGLAELDQLRQQYLQLRLQAHVSDTATAATASRERALGAFTAIDARMLLDAMTPAEIRGLEQWTSIREHLNTLTALLSPVRQDHSPQDFTEGPGRYHAPAPEQERILDWRGIRDQETQLSQMFRNARYRLDPAPGGHRANALLTPSQPARGEYERILTELEGQFARLRNQMLREIGGPATPEPAADPDNPAEMLAGDLVLERAERYLRVYRDLIEHAQQRPFSPEQLYSRSYDLTSAYRTYIDQNVDYGNYLFRLESAESALRGAIANAGIAHGRTAARPMSTEAGHRLNTLMNSARSAMDDRRATRALLFLDEIAGTASRAREAENRELAKRMGDQPTTAPLTENETAALQNPDYHGQSWNVGTAFNRLQQVPELSRTDAQGYVRGVFRMEGEFSRILVGLGEVRTIVSRDNNALVGDIGPAEEETTIYGHVPMRRVIGLNAAGVEILGGGVIAVPSGALVRIRLEDVR